MDRCLIDFERMSMSSVGAKDRDIEFVLGLSSDAYYRRLLELILDHRAHTYDPLTMLRVERMIEPEVGVEAFG